LNKIFVKLNIYFRIKINYKINTNKQNIVYESIQRFITITIDINKVEKITIIVFLILTFAILLFSIFS
jgi:hypothetical protein